MSFQSSMKLFKSTIRTEEFFFRKIEDYRLRFLLIVPIFNTWRHLYKFSHRTSNFIAIIIVVHAPKIVPLPPMSTITDSTKDVCIAALIMFDCSPVFTTGPFSITPISEKSGMHFGPNGFLLFGVLL